MLIRSLIRALVARPSIPKGRRLHPFIKLLSERRSIRHFFDRDIPDDDLDTILEIGRLSPSTANLQTWSFISLRRAEWEKTFGSPIPFGAPLAIAVCVDLDRIRRAGFETPPYPLSMYTIGLINACLAAMNMQIAAHALGYGTVMVSDTGRVGFMHTQWAQEQLALPPGVFPVCTLLVGSTRMEALLIPPRLPRELVAMKGAYTAADPKLLNQWYEEMGAVVRAQNPFMSIHRRLDMYLKELPRVEAELARLIYGDESAPHSVSGAGKGDDA
jgi:nitroreductase